MSASINLRFWAGTDVNFLSMFRLQFNQQWIRVKVDSNVDSNADVIAGAESAMRIDGT